MGWTHLPQSPPALRVLKRVLSRWHPALWLEKLEGHQAWSTQRVRRHPPHGMFLITFFPEVKTEIVFSPSPNGGRRGQITRNPDSFATRRENHGARSLPTSVNSPWAGIRFIADRTSRIVSCATFRALCVPSSRTSPTCLGSSSITRRRFRMGARN